MTRPCTKGPRVVGDDDRAAVRQCWFCFRLMLNMQYHFGCF
jgi:hypothetical protein